MHVELKRMEEGIQINMEEGLFRKDMLSVNILKPQVFPSFSESYFIIVDLFSVPSLGFLYSTFTFHNPHKNFLFNFVTSKPKLFFSFPVFLSVCGLPHTFQFIYVNHLQFSPPYPSSYPTSTLIVFCWNPKSLLCLLA